MSDRGSTQAARGAATMETAGPLLRLRNLSKIFKLEAGLFAAAGRYVWAVNDVSIDVRRGETYGLVGESGSGKTTLARTIVQLVPHSSGTIHYYPVRGDGRLSTDAPWEINRHDGRTLRYFRSEVKYVFQDPASALDPRMNVLEILTTGAKYNPRTELRTGARERAVQVLEAVGLRAADLDRRPTEFSGGQRQRISLARAILGNPAALICDEVVSALDVSIQGQILNLLIDLKRQYDLTLIFIAHDLTVVSYMADRIGVMYGGCIMEEASSELLVQGPLHPYTKLLYNSVPELGKPIRERDEAPGTPYNATARPVGCPFAGRCPMVQDVCRREKPELRLVEGHKVACHLVR